MHRGERGDELSGRVAAAIFVDGDERGLGCERRDRPPRFPEYSEPFSGRWDGDVGPGDADRGGGGLGDGAYVSCGGGGFGFWEFGRGCLRGVVARLGWSF